MSQGQGDQPDFANIPTLEVHRAYQESLETRNAFTSGANMTSMSGDVRPQLHQKLHETTLRYYEVMRQYLASRNAVREEWEEAFMWTETQVQGNVVHGTKIEKTEVTGLQQLDPWFFKSERTTREVRTAHGIYEVDQEQPQLLAVEVLFQACRHLDTAANKLDLLAEVPEDIEGEEVTEEEVAELFGFERGDQ